MSARFDQHFLVDRKAIERIAGTIRVEGRTVLEIGPGQGALTAALLDRGARVVGVELDVGLLEALSERFSREIGEGSFVLVHGDAVSCPLPGFDVVVSNLPYSASSKITFRLLEAGFEEAVLMYQSEFADRMLAPAGTPDCGRLSVMVQTYCAVGKVFDLSPRAFSPREGTVDCRPYHPPRTAFPHKGQGPICTGGQGALRTPQENRAELPEEFGVHARQGTG